MRSSAAAKLAPDRPAFLPRGLQRPFMYAYAMELYRLYVLVLHRRYGKGRMILNAMGSKARDEGWPCIHTFPTYSQGREVLWTTTDRHGRRMLDDLLPYTSHVDDTRMRMTFAGGGFYQVVGMDTFNQRIGMNVKAVAHDEFSLQKAQGRNYFAPMLKETQGVEILAGTYRGENHLAGAVDYALAYPELAYLLVLGIGETVRDAPWEERFGEPVVSEEDVADERKLYAASRGKLGMSDEMIDQEFKNSREGVNSKKVYGKQMRALRLRGDVTRVSHDPLKLVHTAWDRGVHNRIGFFQLKGGKGGPVSIIDHLSTDNSDLPEIVKMMKEDGPEGQPRSKYVFGSHYVAQDAEHRMPWVTQTGWQMAEGLGIKFTIVPNLLVKTGIERVKAMLARTEFDARFCGELVQALRDYEWAVDKDTGEIKGEEPDKSQTCRHDADMVRYIALSLEDAEDKKGGSAAGPPEPQSVGQGEFAG